MTAADAAIEAVGLERRFRRETDSLTIRLTSLAARRGDVILLTGPSGSGKSTVLAMLGGVGSPDAARRWRLRGGDGEVVEPEAGRGVGAGRRAALERFRARHVGYVLQRDGLVPYLSLRENIEEPLRLAAIAGRRVERAAAAEAAEALRITDVLDRKPHDASVGQRQRAAIARALAHRPAIVFADEPTSALDDENAAFAERLLLDAARRFGAALVIASHRPLAAQAERLIRARHDVTVGPDGPISSFEA